MGLLNTKAPWRILIADDDASVREVTKIILEDTSFEGRKLELLEAESGANACLILEKEKDIAVMLLDVVMETKDAGLNVVKYTRNDLSNNCIQIVLRTGHPGDFPPEQILIKYNINDYLEKETLNAERLRRNIFTSLRNYKNILSLEETSIRTRCIVSEAAHGIITISSTGIIESFNPAAENIFGYQAKEVIGENISTLMPEPYRSEHDQYLQKYIKTGHSNIINSGGRRITGNRKNKTQVPLNLAISKMQIHGECVFQGIVVDITEQERHEQELENTRLEIIQRLGRAAEFKDNETGLHVLRMSHFSHKIALKYGLPEDHALMLLHAAPMHDVGKIGIPDGILLKAGPLDAEEWSIMKKHPGIGAGIIGQHTDSPLLEMARVVALSHHEKWDGTGYPKGLKEDQIPIEGRIVAIADVFDALTTERPYKNAWPLEKAIEFIKENSGKHFDPKVVAAFIAVFPEVQEIRDRFAEKVVERTSY